MLFWLALAFALVATVAAIVYAALKGLELFRAAKRVLRTTGEDLDRIGRATREIELHLRAAETSGSSLSASLTRLHASRARLAVLTSAVGDVRASVGRITGVVPRK
jgi:hypothetical protein